jgi:hypothetical protein
MKFSDGQVYRGDVRNGIRCGSGSNHWMDGQDYSGEWKGNSRDGRGTHTWPDGRKVAGQWTEGHLNGKVYFSWPNGATFDGTCLMGKKHGRGTYFVCGEENRLAVRTIYLTFIITFCTLQVFTHGLTAECTTATLRTGKSMVLAR